MGSGSGGGGGGGSGGGGSGGASLNLQTQFCHVCPMRMHACMRAGVRGRGEGGKVSAWWCAWACAQCVEWPWHEGSRGCLTVP